MSTGNCWSYASIETEFPVLCLWLQHIAGHYDFAHAGCRRRCCNWTELDAGFLRDGTDDLKISILLKTSQLQVPRKGNLLMLSNKRFPHAPMADDGSKLEMDELAETDGVDNDELNL